VTARDSTAGSKGGEVLLQWWTPAGARSERVCLEREAQLRRELLALGAVVWSSQAPG
jgi:hypothetical protein